MNLLDRSKDGAAEPTVKLLRDFVSEQPCLNTPIVVAGKTASDLRGQRGGAALDGDVIHVQIATPGSYGSYFANYLQWKGLSLRRTSGQFANWVSDGPVRVGGTEQHVLLEVGQVSDNFYRGMVQGNCDWIDVGGLAVPVAEDRIGSQLMEAKLKVLRAPTLFSARELSKLPEAPFLIQLQKAAAAMGINVLVVGATAGALRGSIEVSDLKSLANREICLDLVVPNSAFGAATKLMENQGLVERQNVEVGARRSSVNFGEFVGRPLSDSTGKQVRVTLSAVREPQFAAVLGNSDDVAVGWTHIPVATEDVARQTYLQMPRGFQDPVTARLLDIGLDRATTPTGILRGSDGSNGIHVASMFSSFSNEASLALV